ncbi:cupin domain-containing protein [Streptomyces niveus]|uniref:cupin domain-containing protein n=1 Tax=Streptomyces niveus TaxID=193462 RepID=UPI00369C8FBF
MTLDSITPTVPGFRVTHPENLDEGRDSVTLYDGITVYPVEWSSPADGTAPIPRRAFVRFEPHAGYPEPDAHDVSAEEVLVVEGYLIDANGVHGPGTLIEGARGTSHTPRTDETGCLLYVTFRDL